MQYRPEIDGLRAIAVLAVVFFHAGLGGFGGGFVGVDIFFVISGYLITSILLAELANGPLNIWRFYERRVRRIAPALLLVLVASAIGAWWLLRPEDLVDFSHSLIGALGFYANVFFYLNSDYFAIENEFRPLLHTWSLAVEEQYYLCFPLGLWLLWRLRKNWLLPTLLIAALLSLAFAQWFLLRNPGGAFYLLPSRAWELLAGALIAAYHQRVGPTKPHQALSAIGLGLIVVSITCYSAQTPFPGIYAVAPVLGSMLIIGYAQRGTAAYWLLSMRGLVGIGLISYSLYLWHQPVFAFARHQQMQPLSASYYGALIALCFALAYTSWRYVETPCRLAQLMPIRRLIMLCAIAALALIAFAALMIHREGDVQRFAHKPGAVAFLQYFSEHQKTHNLHQQYRDECNFYDLSAHEAGRPTRVPKRMIDPSCTQSLAGAKASKRIMIWGDSYAQMLASGLQSQLPDDWQHLQVASSGCSARLVRTDEPAHYCSHSNYVALQTIEAASPATVLIAQRSGHSIGQMKQLNAALKIAGVKQVIFVGPALQWHRPLPYLMLRKQWPMTGARSWLGVKSEIVEHDATLKTQAQEAKLEYISLIDLFCTAQGCLTHTGEDLTKDIISFDEGHFTRAASAYIAKHALVPAMLGYPR